MILIVLLIVFSEVFSGIAIESLHISANLKPVKRGATLVARDRARIRERFARYRKRAKNVELENTGSDFTVNVGIGSPPTYYKLQVDTGSRYTWIGAGKKYVKTGTSIKQRGQKFKMNYSKGSVSGAHYKDDVTLSSSLHITSMPFGVASKINMAIKDYDGILGLGPPTLDRNVIRPNAGEPVPSVIDALFSQIKIQQNVFGLYYAPFTSHGTMTGRLSVGGADPRRYTGELDWVKVTTNEPCSRYWGFEQTIKYGDQVIQPSSTGFVDSGTTLISITPQAFKSYYESISGSSFDQSVGLLEIPQNSVGFMKSLFFIIGDVSYEFTPNAQLWPRTLNTRIGGKADAYYSVIESLSEDEVNQGINFINGYVFSERFYTAYNLSNSMIGFATTSSTYVNVD